MRKAGADAGRRTGLRSHLGRSSTCHGGLSLCREDGARGEGGPRSVLGLLHAPAEMLRSQHATQEAMTDLAFLGSKITADSDGSRETKRAYFLEGKR